MEFHGKRALRTIMDDEGKNIHSPRRVSFGSYLNADETHCNYAPARSSSASASSLPLPPMSPETPWTLSPKNPSSSCNYALARSSSASASSLPLPPMSPETPWTLSPKNPSSSSTLPYHCLASLHRHEGNILSIAVSRDYIFAGSESSRMYAWKQPDCIGVGSIKASSGGVRAILVVKNMLFSTHSDCKIRTWDVSPKENFQPKKIATLPRKGSIFLFPKRSTYQHRDYISCIAYNEVEKILYTGSWDKTVKAWKVSENRCVDSFVAHDGRVNAIVVNQIDGCLFTCSSDGSVKIWRKVYGESSHSLTMTLSFQPSPINALALSSSLSNCFLYSGSSDGLINFYEKERMSSRFNYRGFLPGHHLAVLCLVTTGEFVLSGSDDEMIRIWRRENGNHLHTCLTVMEGHHGPVRCLAAFKEENISKGLLVYSASLDRTFKVWRVGVLPIENVNPQDSVAGNEQKETADFDKETAEGEICPVLSPSWVERRLHRKLFESQEHAQCTWSLSQ